MSWPLSHEFNEAIQNPKVAFADPDLRDGEVVVGATGLPLPRSGNFADVYQMRGADGRDWAVKCFTRPVFGLGERYAKVSEALKKANLPFAVGFKFLSEGIRVGGVWRPIVVMEWVEGMLLNQVVRDAAEKPSTLGALGQMWVKLCKRLREAGLAHADLQHGNVLMVPGTRAGAYGLKLIDYDGVWVPALANTPSGESGHPSFQHPARAATRAYSPDVDRFPHLVVATALRGLAVAGDALWEKYDNGDNLLFTEDDYKKPSESKVMRELWQLEHPAVQALVGRLAIACEKPIPQTPWLDQLAPEGEPAPLDDQTRREAAAALGIALPVPVALPPEPVPLPPEPHPAFEPLPLPVNPFAAIEEIEEEQRANEVDVELVEDAKPKPKKAKTPAKPKRAAPAYDGPKSGGNGLLIAGGALGALLLAVAAVVGVLVFGGSKPKPGETVEQKEDPTPVQPKNGPGEPVVPPKSGDNTPLVVPPKNETNNSVPPATKWAIAPRWSRPLPGDWRRAPSLRIGPDSRTGQVDGGDGMFVVFDTGSGQPLKNPPDAAGIFYGVHVLNDGRVAKTWQVPGGPLPIWDARAGKEAAPLPRSLDGPVHVEVSPNNRYMAAYPGHGQGKVALKLTDTTTGKTIVDTTWKRGAVRFTADSSRALILDESGKCRWVKLPSGDADGEWSVGDGTGSVGVIAMSGDGSRVVLTGSRFNGRHIVDGRTGQLVRQVQTDINHSGLSHDGKVLIQSRYEGSDRVVEICDTDTGTVRLPVHLPADTKPGECGLAPDGTAAFVVCSTGDTRYSLHRYNITGPGGAVAPESGDTGPFPPQGTQFDLRLVWTNDENLNSGLYPICTLNSKLVMFPGVLGGDARGSVLDTATGKVVARSEVQPKDMFAQIVPLRDERFAITTQHSREKIPVIEARTGNRAGELPFIPGPPYLSFQQVSADTRYVALCVPKTPREPAAFKLIRASDEKVLLNIECPAARAFFTADGDRVLLAESTGAYRWFKLPGGEPDGRFELAPAAGKWQGSGLAAMSGDGSVLVFSGTLDGHDGEGHLIDGRTGRVRASVRAPYDTRNPSLSADGTLVAMSHEMRPGQMSVRVLRTDTAEVVAELKPQPDTSFHAALLPDGSGLITRTTQQRVARTFAQRYDFVRPGAAPPASPIPGPGVAEVRERFKTQLDIVTRSALFDAEGRAILACEWNKRELALVDTRTGTAQVANAPNALHPNSLFLLPGARIGLCPAGSKTITALSTETGKTVDTIAMPTFPAGSSPFFSAVCVSPNERYVVAGLNSSTKPDPDTKRPVTTPSPFGVLDTKTNKMVIEGEWTSAFQGGRLAFSADSSRVLVLESTLRGRWFKLPSGEPDGVWSYADAANTPERVHILGLSRDARVVLCNGPVDGRSRTFVLDATTGARTTVFAEALGVVSGLGLSADGRRALLFHRKPTAKERDFVVADTATGAEVARVSAPLAPDTDLQGALSPDGRALVVFDSHKAAPLVVYDIPAGPGAGSVAPPVAGAGGPVESAPPGEPPALASKWDSKVGEGKAFDQLLFAPEANAVLLGSAAGGFEALDPKSGIPRTVGFTVLNSVGITDFFALRDGRIGTLSPKATEIKVWDGKSGRLLVKYPLPDPGPGIGGATTLSAFLAPDEKHLAVTRSGPPAPDQPTAPFKVFDAAGKKEERTLDWKGGSVHFTTGSPRMLIAEWSGRCRWFDLSSGAAAGSWDLGPDGAAHKITSTSADGAVLGYTGPAASKGNGSAVLDGKTGKPIRVFHRDYHPNTPVEVSADGKRAALVRQVARDAVSIDVVDLATGARVGRAKLARPAGVPAAAPVPLFALAPDGHALVAYDPASGRAQLFELPK